MNPIQVVFRVSFLAAVLAVSIPLAPPPAAAEALFTPTGADAGAGVDPLTELEERIRVRIERNGGAAAVIAVADERVHAVVDLPRFYEGRGFRPAWVDVDGPLALADSVVAALERADREGLDPDDYHLPRIRAVLAELRRSGAPAAGRVVGTPAARLVDLELLLTDAFLLYGAHLVAGRVDPVTMHAEWSTARREADLVAVLNRALDTGAVASELETLLPVHPEYFRLRSTLERYREIARAGGLPEIPGRQLRPGVRDPAVPLLREWARAMGDLPADAPTPPDATVLDPALEESVRRIQERHALAPTGVVTLATSAAMNVPVEERIRTLELNLERWRWLPRELGERHIRVNIAGFYVKVLEGDSVGFTSRVMVGQRYRETPVFSDRMTYLVLNPTWTIPPGILEQDKLPLIRRDPAGYLRANRIRVLDSAGREVEPGSVDWSKVTGKTSYRLRMDPGPENPLGQVKFMFPNAYSIYLHDTPSREDFDRSRRDFSSGCIRVERPLDLAAYLLRDDPRWTPDRIAAALRNPGEQTIPLRRPVPVHLLYWTAWADHDGHIHFHEDVYGRDSALDQALSEPGSTATP